MNVASKAEAMANRDKMRKKAGDSYLKLQAALALGHDVEIDVAREHYHRCIREFEEAINDMGNWENGEASD